MSARARRPCHCGLFRRMKRRRSDIPIHLALIAIVAMTLLPFVFVINNSMRRTSEQFHSFFGLPAALTDLGRFTWYRLSVQSEKIEVRPTPDAPLRRAPYGAAVNHSWNELTRGFVYCWGIFRPYMINSLIVSGASALGVVVFASISAYVFSRYRFPGHRVLFFAVLSFMMIPGVLTLVPSFLWVKRLGLLNTHWAMIL